MSKIDEIVNGYASNELTYIDREGEHKISIDEFVKTGSANVLQKLNRTEQVLLKVANAAPEKLKWVNDYAMMKVVDKLYERIDDLSTGLIEKDTEIERLNNEATASRVAFETADGIPKEEAEKLIQRIEGMEADEQIHLSQIDQLIKERDEALEHESIAIKQMKTKTDEYTALEERFNKSVEAYKTLKAENTELNNKLINSSADMDSQYNDLATKYNSVKEELENLQSEAAVVTDRHNQLVKQYEEEVKLNKNLQEEYDKLNVEYNAGVVEIITLKDQLDANANDMGHEIDVLNTRLDNIMGENEKLTDKITELQQLKTDLEQELNSYAGEFEKASARCQAIDSRNEELNLECENQKGLIVKLEEQYNSTCDELNNLKESFGEATGHIRNLDSTNVELQNKINEQESLINGLQETINSINNERTELQNNLEEKNKENALLNAKIRNSEDMNNKVQNFENAINDFLNAIEWSEKTPENVHKSPDNTQHRMGDNQVVNFNMGM